MRNVVMALALSAAVLNAQETQPAARMVTLEECIRWALEKNLSIRVESYTPRISNTLVKSAHSVFDPQLTATVQDTDSKLVKTSFFSPSQINEANWDFGLAQLLPTSTSYSLTFNNSRNTTDSTFATLTPYFQTNLALRLSQPVLKNFGPKIAQSKVRIAKKDAEASEQQFRVAVTETLSQVQKIYWAYVASLDNLKVQQQSLQLAKDLLDQNRVRVQVGTLAPIDIVQSEAEVASREEGILTAEKLVYDAEDALKVLINLPGDQKDWSQKIMPADKAEFAKISIDEKGMLDTAAAKRPELEQVRRSIEGKEISRAYAKNQLRPDLSLFAQAGSVGARGTLTPDAENDPDVTAVPGGYSDALADALKHRYPSWTFGFNFTINLTNEAAEASYEQATLQKLQAEMQLKNLEQTVYQEVRTTCRRVETDSKRVEATQAALRLAEKKLEAEQKKYSVGLSTNFLVLQFQRDLAEAQKNLLQAITDYKLSLVELERVTGQMLENHNVEIAPYLQ